MHGRGTCMAGECMVGGTCGRGHAPQGGWVCMVGGTCVARGAYVAGGACMVGETATAADSTHPTGMHSCSC